MRKDTAIDPTSKISSTSWKPVPALNEVIGKMRNALLTSTCLTLITLPAFAQPRVQIAVPGDDTPADARESLSVTLNESLDARKDIETARNMEQQKEWNK